MSTLSWGAQGWERLGDNTAKWGCEQKVLRGLDVPNRVFVSEQPELSHLTSSATLWFYDVEKFKSLTHAFFVLFCFLSLLSHFPCVLVKNIQHQ